MNKTNPVVPKECTHLSVASLKYGDIVSIRLFCHTLVHIMQATANSILDLVLLVVHCNKLPMMRFQTDLRIHLIVSNFEVFSIEKG